MAASYFRAPSEPGGDDDIIAEVVDGKLRRRIDIINGVASCMDYPVSVGIAAVAEYVWPISEVEFNEAWTQHCSGTTQNRPTAG